jgi:hypothetical protein
VYSITVRENRGMADTQQIVVVAPCGFSPKKRVRKTAMSGSPIQTRLNAA